MPYFRMPYAATLALMIFTFITAETSAGPRSTLSVIIPGSTANPMEGASVNQHTRQRVSIFRKARMAWYVAKQLNKALIQLEDPIEGDRLAKSSRTLGIIGISCLGGIIIPYVGTVAFLGALVLGIIAIVQGRSARRLGSKQKTGELLGYITVGLWALFLILAVALVYLLLVSWGG
jgi:hypothetical protein